MIDQIANEIILASIEMKTNDVSRIASELGYQPILLLNALFKGERDGKFVYVKKKDIISISTDVEVNALSVTEGLSESRAMIEEFITNENSLEVDLSFEELHGFIPMLPELHMKIAIKTSRLLSTYEIADPKDKKSVYTFITLKENIYKKWGLKQFDATKKSKFAKAGKKA